MHDFVYLFYLQEKEGGGKDEAVVSQAMDEVNLFNFSW